MGTTINIEPSVRDRLKTYGTSGMSYNDILRVLMDSMDRDVFFAEVRRIAANPKAESWVRLEDLE